jgi:hypothetical protein
MGLLDVSAAVSEFAVSLVFNREQLVAKREPYSSSFGI